MKKNILIILFLFILANNILAQEPSNNIINKNANNNNNNYNDSTANNNNYNNSTANNNSIANINDALSSHRHSIGVDFGPTIFYMLIAPSVFNLALPSNDPSNLKLQGTFGLGLTYTYRLTEKMDVNVDAGFYNMKTYYDNAKATYNGNVYGLGLSAGLRFYFNKKDRASGFFLMPKVGTTLFITHGREYQKDSSSYTNRNSNIMDFYISGEMGFRIDLSRGLGVNSGIRPFLDISIIDIGISYKSLIRLVPLPRFSIGILF
ncbi:autotransporter outer membrane beta-barrel domain-containing protein [Brachyspira hyodysenteriae]|uniref:autotransporter outer membrane beta-barrel domain-containing protein n=1 Tax=Brachyspira hyodysenteriae TaxID=159 RepID=UPI00063D89C8|nr:autotransporter outer membrane beta-barrel domain-containing protein [Brachyspira hyodysenteriae]KLI22040.1 hypothetical protein SU46_00675 [Brachyspira hyodysenteriae]KLI39892.1 hypothetical protein SZ51_02185 [Brachyspira hyodysenteriae]KLI45506.1 hypothetical protein SZ53_00955 [Brachyspira hyodysenteriae]